MNGNIHIENSYKVRKKDFDKTLDGIRETAYKERNESELAVFNNRSRFSMKCEWAVHNFLYSIGLWRERTKDCDIDFPCDKPEWIYCIIGCLVWIFIK